MPMDMDAARKLVANGAALLDEYARRGWRNVIDRDRLDIHDPRWCVLGQLTRREGDSYIPGATGYSTAAHDILEVNPSTYGFNCSCRDAATLTAAWREYLDRTAGVTAEVARTLSQHSSVSLGLTDE